LPASLREACESLVADRNFLKTTFGDDALDSLIEQQLKEHNEVVVRPHPHEFSMYANV
jgi:glutamine synthetase